MSAVDIAWTAIVSARVKLAMRYAIRGNAIALYRVNTWPARERHTWTTQGIL